MFVEYICILGSWAHEYVDKGMPFYEGSECRWMVPGTWNED